MPNSVMFILFLPHNLSLMFFSLSPSEQAPPGAFQLIKVKYDTDFIRQLEKANEKALIEIYRQLFASLLNTGLEKSCNEKANVCGYEPTTDNQSSCFRSRK